MQQTLLWSGFFYFESQIEGTVHQGWGCVVAGTLSAVNITSEVRQQTDPAVPQGALSLFFWPSISDMFKMYLSTSVIEIQKFSQTPT